MYDPNNPIFQVTDPNHGKSETEILMERVRQAQLKNMEGQLNKAEQLQAKIDKPQQAQRNLAPIMALADTIAPGKNLLQTYMATKPKDPRLKDEALLRQYQQNAASSANALASGVYQSGGLDRQKEMADYNHKYAMERIAANKANKDADKAAKDSKLRDISATEVRKINEGNAIPTMLQDVEDLIKEQPELFSPVVGTLKGMNPYDSAAKTANASIRARAQAFGRFMEGGVLRKEDEEKYRKMFPQLGDTPEVARNKLQTVKRLLVQKQNSDIEALKAQNFNVSGLDKGFKLPARAGKQGKQEEKIELKSPAARDLAKEFGI